MNASVAFLVTVRVDNMGGKFVACDTTAISHTKHVGIRYEYDDKYIEDSIVKIVFLKSADILLILLLNVSILLVIIHYRPSQSYHSFCSTLY